MSKLDPAMIYGDDWATKYTEKELIKIINDKTSSLLEIETSLWILKYHNKRNRNIKRNRNNDNSNNIKRRKLDNGRYQTTILSSNNNERQKYKIISEIIEYFNIDIACPIHDISQLYYNINYREGWIKCHGCNDAKTARIQRELLERIMKHENGHQFWEYLDKSHKIYFPMSSDIIL